MIQCEGQIEMTDYLKSKIKRGGLICRLMKQ